MIWGARAHGLQTDLITINGNVNTECIINDIFKKSNVIQLVNSEYGELKWIFQKDGACPHTSKKTQTYLNRGYLTEFLMTSSVSSGTDEDNIPLQDLANRSNKKTSSSSSGSETNTSEKNKLEETSDTGGESDRKIKENEEQEKQKEKTKRKTKKKNKKKNEGEDKQNETSKKKKKKRN
ncbi:hypothetical protein M0813_11713 [Anaeramoeba flamelloides]|uniref:Uncharacterized protein n=1 Tax=Anaeramoeba flamelloides TaxID=1746091 RepID=A0ABQ8ZE40_9EUKA|nr:hypothetical protein M0813_11713 [Anaeramoeba flamelloides]